jgi:hypothetical protein
MITGYASATIGSCHPTRSDHCRLRARPRRLLHGTFKQGYTSCNSFWIERNTHRVRPRASFACTRNSDQSRRNTLTLRSVIATTAPHFQALTAPNSRISALAALPSLPSPLVVPLKPEYPVFNIPAPNTELPFPSQPQHKPQARPTLSAGRLNPFASLFGVKASPASTPIALPSTPTNEESEGRSSSVNVSVYVIQGRIIKKDVVKGIANSVRAEMKEALTGLPSWIVDRAISFTAPLLPFNGSDSKKSLAKQPSSPKVELDISDQTRASESFQAFYFSLEEEMKQKEMENESSEKKTERHYDAAAEERRLQTVERVERAICALFYDQYVFIFV